MFRLDVFYDLDFQDGLVWRDEEIEEVAGAKIVGAGCGMGCGVRDCELHFPTEEAMETAKFELREAGFRLLAACTQLSDFTANN